MHAVPETRHDERRPVKAPPESSAKKTGPTVTRGSDSGRHADPAGPSGAVGTRRRGVLRQRAFTAEEEAGLAAARQLVSWGVPLFLAKPDVDSSGRWLPEGGHRKTGYWFPPKWQHSTPDLTVVDRWRPGMALCAVMGHGLDLLDVDPRNGGDASRASLTAEGVWPAVHCQAATPSGGQHDFVSSMGVRSRDDLFPGLDLKAGSAGRGHGFAFIAPTVRRSKTTAEVMPYRWLRPPVGKRPAPDDSGLELVQRSPLGRDRSAVRHADVAAPTRTSAGPDIDRALAWGREQLAMLSPREEPCAAMLARLQRAEKELANGGRHDAILGNVVQLVRLAKEGHIGLPRALHRLSHDFVMRVADDRGGRAAAEAEWQRSLDGALSEVLGSHGVLPRFPACDCFLRQLREATTDPSLFTRAIRDSPSAASWTTCCTRPGWEGPSTFGTPSARSPNRSARHRRRSPLPWSVWRNTAGSGRERESIRCRQRPYDCSCRRCARRYQPNYPPI